MSPERRPARLNQNQLVSFWKKIKKLNFNRLAQWNPQSTKELFSGRRSMWTIRFASIAIRNAQFVFNYSRKDNNHTPNGRRIWLMTLSETSSVVVYSPQRSSIISVDSVQIGCVHRKQSNNCKKMATLDGGGSVVRLLRLSETVSNDENRRKSRFWFGKCLFVEKQPVCFRDRLIRFILKLSMGVVQFRFQNSLLSFKFHVACNHLKSLKWTLVLAGTPGNSGFWCPKESESVRI